MSSWNRGQTKALFNVVWETHFLAPHMLECVQICQDSTSYVRMRSNMSRFHLIDIDWIMLSQTYKSLKSYVCHHRLPGAEFHNHSVWLHPWWHVSLFLHWGSSYSEIKLDKVFDTKTRCTVNWGNLARFSTLPLSVYFPADDSGSFVLLWYECYIVLMALVYPFQLRNNYLYPSKKYT